MSDLHGAQTLPLAIPSISRPDAHGPGNAFHPAVRWHSISAFKKPTLESLYYELDTSPFPFRRFDLPFSFSRSRLRSKIGPCQRKDT
jgi:hypothetical protein